jgi:hypothetical protein
MAQINKPTDYFNTVLYTGNGSTQSITGVGFSPEFLWLKERTSTSYHRLSDIIRGTNKQLSSNVTDAEETISTVVSSYDSDGFTVGADNGSNESGQTYVGWSWLAGGTASSNTDGSITSSVSVNTTSGFSIVSYTGTGSTATIGHGLGVIPKMYIIKKRDTSGTDWTVGGSVLGGTTSSRKIALNGTGAVATGLDASWWNNTDPTSSVITIGTQGDLNGSGATYIAYCFAEKKGFSKFGSYTSNNSADGTFVYTGFKPAFLLLKNTTTANTSWELYDNKRTPTNVANLFLRPNTSEADISSDRLDILSNGFKLRQVGDTNANSDNIIYMAFAENPLVGTNNIPATAR